MKGKSPLTLFLLQIVCFIFPPHQEQELSQVPPHFAKKGKGKIVSRLIQLHAVR